jgi:hypothetical protein
MKFGGVLRDLAGKPLTGTVDVTFSLYSTEAGGSALWFETQSVQADELGRYTALVGAMHADGLPVELFASGEVRWLGIQVGSETEQQPRVLLVSVPYALKAGDAATLGGKPASAYMLSDAEKGAGSTTDSTSSATKATKAGTSAKDQKSGTAANSALTPCTSVTSDGTAVLSSIALFTDVCNIQSANIFQFNGNIGVGTAQPNALLHISGPALQVGDARYNAIVSDSTPAAAGVGGGILFSGYYNNSTDKAAFANIRGVKENNTQGNYASSLVFETQLNGANQTERMRINSAGFVGIGTSTPRANLQVYGNALPDGDARFNILATDNTPSAAGVGGGISFTGNFSANGAKASFANIRGIKENSTQGDYAAALIFDTRVNGGPETERMRIDSVGHLGIGTTTPISMLEVRDTGQLSNTGTQTVRIGTALGASGTVTDALHLDAKPATAYDQGLAISLGYKNSINGEYTSRIVHYGFAQGTRASKLQLQTHTATQGIWNPGILIDNVGNVGVGLTNPAVRLDVAGNIRASGITTVGGVFTGAGSGLTNLNASNLSSGTVPDAQLSGTYSNILTFSNPSNVYYGDGSNLTGIGDITAVTAGTGLTGGGSSGQVGLNIDPTVVPELSIVNRFTNTQNVNTDAGTAFVAATNDANTAAAVFSNSDSNGDVIEVFPPGALAAAITNPNGSRSLQAIRKPGAPIMRVTAALDVYTSGSFQGSNFNADANNTLVGVSAGNPAMTGNNNTSLGYNTLSSNSSGTDNAAAGEYALHANTTGSYNTAVGGFSLYNNTSAGSNVGLGYYALLASTDAGGNTAVGYSALANNCSGVPTGCTAINNTAVGNFAGIGSNSNTSGYNNTFVGYNSGPGTSTPIHNATAIGENAWVSLSNSMALGGTGADAVNVGIGTSSPSHTLDVMGDINISGCYLFSGSGTYGNCASDRRLKTNIQPLAPVLDRMVQLQPVYFNWKSSNPPEYRYGSGTAMGLIAQEVQQVFPEMVRMDTNGYRRVNYSELPLLLLESVRELKAENDDLRAQIKSQEERARSQKDDEVAKLRQEVEELRALITTKSSAQPGK